MKKAYREVAKKRPFYQRHCHKSWQNNIPHGGKRWSCRIIWFQQGHGIEDCGSIRLQLEDADRLQNLYPVNRDEAVRIWNSFKELARFAEVMVSECKQHHERRRKIDDQRRIDKPPIIRGAVSEETLAHLLKILEPQIKDAEARHESDMEFQYGDE